MLEQIQIVNHSLIFREVLIIGNITHPSALAGSVLSMSHYLVNARGGLRVLHAYWSVGIPLHYFLYPPIFGSLALVN